MKRRRRIIHSCFLILVPAVSTVMPFSPSFDLQAPLITQIETASTTSNQVGEGDLISQIVASGKRIEGPFGMLQQPGGLPTHLVESLARNRYANKGDDAGDNIMTIPPMQGRVAVITGAAGGIGHELTKVVYSLGGTVVALDRNVTGLELLREDLEGRRSNGSKDIEYDRSRVLCLVTNHEDLSSVSSSADVIKTRFGTIDLLVCNAGLTYRDDCEPGEERMKSKQGYDLAFTVNYLSHFLLVEKLLPCLSSAHPSGRIVHLTSSFHWKVDGSEITPLDNGVNGPMAYQSDPSLMSSKHIERSYANSKLAQIWHSRTTKKCVGSLACPTWAGTGIAGEESRDFLLKIAFDVSGPGIASALNAMVRSDDELGDALNDGKSIVANSRVIEYIPFKDLWAMDWISRSGLRDIMAEVSALLLLIGQRFTFEQFIIQKSSPESYGCRDEMESLRRWSLKEVEPFL